MGDTGSSFRGLRIYRGKHVLWISTDEHLKLRNSTRIAWKWNWKAQQFIRHSHTGGIMPDLMESTRKLESLPEDEQRWIIEWLWSN
jgi:hypothetical protein